MFIVIILNYYGIRITILMEIRDGVGCRMGGLQQACAQTIHGYFIWVENPFFMFVLEIVIVWGNMGKPMKTITMLDTCGMNNNNNNNIVSFVLSPHDILSLNHNDCSFVSTKRFPAHCRRPGSDSSRWSYWPLVFLWAIDSNSMFIEGVVIVVDAK